MQMSSIRLPLNQRPLSWMILKIWRDNWRPLILNLQTMVSSHSRYHLVSPFRSPLQIECDWSSLSYSVQLHSRGSTDNPPKEGKKTTSKSYWLLTANVYTPKHPDFIFICLKFCYSTCNISSLSLKVSTVRQNKQFIFQYCQKRKKIWVLSLHFWSFLIQTRGGIFFNPYMSKWETASI